MLTPLFSDNHKQTAELLEDTDLLDAINNAADLFAVLHKEKLPSTDYCTLWTDYSGNCRHRYKAELQQYINTLHNEYRLRVTRNRMLFEGVLKNRASPGQALDRLRRFPTAGTAMPLSWNQAVYDSHKAYFIRRNPSHYRMRFEVSRTLPLEYIFPKAR